MREAGIPLKASLILESISTISTEGTYRPSFAEAKSKRSVIIVSKTLPELAMFLKYDRRIGSFACC